MWLEERLSEISTLKAPTAVPDGIGTAFARHLRGDVTAKRLVADLLPKVPVEKLAEFVALITDASTESKLLDLTEEWGQSFRRVLRSKARKNPQLQEAEPAFFRPSEVLKRASFDVRRQGLTTPSPFNVVILKRYCEFKGFKPTLKELAALLGAGFAAMGRPRIVDPDLLRRSLKRYERKHPMVSATPELCARIIDK